MMYYLPDCLVEALREIPRAVAGTNRSEGMCKSLDRYGLERAKV